MTELHTHAVANATMQATARTRANLGLHHLLAACRFSSRIRDIERDNIGQPFGPFWEEILQHSLGVATLTVAALESYANEMYFEGAILKPALNQAAAKVLAEVADRESILKKYEIALSIAAGKHLTTGSPPVQDVDALIKLRNAVVHFRPEWFDDQDKHQKLSKTLQGKFQPTVFLSNESIFPRAWASYSFSVWALKATVAFLGYFCAEIGIASVIDPFRPQLSTLAGHAL